MVLMLVCYWRIPNQEVYTAMELPPRPAMLVECATTGHAHGTARHSMQQA